MPEMQKYHLYLIFTIVLLAIIIFILAVVIVFLVKRSKASGHNVFENGNTNDFGNRVFKERLGLMKKLVSICLIYKNENQKVIQKYGEVVDLDILQYYLGWPNIIQTVDFLYHNFTERIKSDFPQLLERDVQLCALLRAKFETNEIAALMLCQDDSIRTMKVRLRKKMKFESQDDFLSYLNGV